MSKVIILLLASIVLLGEHGAMADVKKLRPISPDNAHPFRKDRVIVGNIKEVDSSGLFNSNHSVWAKKTNRRYTSGSLPN